jgi:hypothetical protein
MDADQAQRATHGLTTVGTFTQAVMVEWPVLTVCLDASSMPVFVGSVWPDSEQSMQPQL